MTRQRKALSPNPSRKGQAMLIPNQDRETQAAFDGYVPAEEVERLRAALREAVDYLNPLHGSLDRQTYDERLAENFDAPRDREYNVAVTAQQHRDLTQAVLILEQRKRAIYECTCGSVKNLPASQVREKDAEIERLQRLNSALRHRLDQTYAFKAGVADLPAENGGRLLPFDRDTLGRMVREAWVRWAQTQPSPKPSWLVPYDELSEPDKEADRQIGETVARWTLIGDAAHATNLSS
jgi:hypothetical protein